MRTAIKSALLGLISTFAGAKTVIMDPPSTSGEPIAIVMIHGMQCDPETYRKLFTEVQSQAVAQGYAPYVAIPEFLFDAPEPVLIDHYVQSSIKDLQDHGFTGENIFMAAHSLGGVMSQKYVKGRTDIKGQILMGSVLLRNNHSIDDQGETAFDYDVPTLTIGGTKDGLLRITRVAESYWHQYTNVQSSQAGMFPVLAIEGGSHASFMDSDIVGKYVLDNDLKADISEAQGHSETAKGIVGLVSQVLKSSSVEDAGTTQILKPLVDAMEYENSYNMKDACYAETLVNPTDDPKCLSGSRWSEQAQYIMAGELPEGK